ncbi:GumC family protein [Salinarimonas sp.]|uniref:GumC family protein n=1 Tax=Salinarimonas sp. TaxID=2766526 RepID=UPI0032D97918
MPSPGPSLDSARAEPREDTVALLEILVALKAHLKLIAAVTLIAFAASLAYVLTTTPRYQGEAQILLEDRDTSFTRPVDAAADDTARVIDEQAVASQVQVIRSRDVAREAIRRLGLVGQPEFDPEARPMNPVSRVLGMIGIAGGSGEGDTAREDRVLEAYYDRLTVFAVDRSRVITIEFQSADPELAARGANTIAEVYLETLEGAKIDAARTASTWLAQNIERLRERVSEAEARVETFRSGTGLLLGRDNATLTTQQLDDVSAQLAAARSTQAESQARAELIRELIEAGRAFEIPDVANDELIRGLIQERVALRTQIANESRTLLPRHPRILALQAQLEDLDAQVRGAAERRVRALENEARLAAARVGTLEAALDRQMQVASRANENEVQLRALEREARAEREQLEVFLARYRDAVVRDSEEAALPDARIVSRAAEPRSPIWPKTAPVVILFTVGALVLVVGAVAMKAIVFDMIRPAMAAASGEPAPMPARAAATGPEAPRDPPPPPPGGGRPAPKPASGREDSGFDVPAIAARLARIGPGDRGRRILVTDLGEGVAAGLALRLADTASGEGLALVVALAPGADETVGMAELVRGEASFFEAIDRMPGGRPHRIAAGAEPLDLADEETRDAFEIALSAFEQTYDWTVLVHAGADDAALAALAPRVDAAVVATQAAPDDPALVARYEALKASGAPDVVVAIAAEALIEAA